MKIPFYLIDAFTNQPLKGNPAAVCLLPHWPADELLRDIAIETNQAETAFVVKQGEGYELRWFTPLIEVDLCGHATLATAHMLFNHEGHAGEVIHFTTRFAGPLSVRKMDDGLELDFPSRPPQSCLGLPPLLQEALNGATPREVWANARDYMLVFETADEVRALKPDMAKLGRLDKWICITAIGDREDVDFVSRFFTPNDGRDEDPVTGSAHAMLTPFWAERLGKTEFTAHQLSTRGGVLKCRMAGARVLIAGQAFTIVTGHFALPDGGPE